MKRFAIIGLAIGGAVLSGCVPPAPVAPPALPPVAAAGPAPLPPPVWTPPVGHHVIRIVHPAHHRWVHHYAGRGYHGYHASAWAQNCGSTAHPCNVEHVAVPTQYP
jgi:hypothetical protein